MIALPTLDLKKIQLNGKMYDVVTPHEYVANAEMYVPTATAIEIEDCVIPIIPRYEVEKGTRTGIALTKNCLIAPYNILEKDRETYSSSNCINLSDNNTIRDLVSKQEKIRDLEAECLTNSDNITVPKIGDTDTPEMVAFKQAVIAKQCDIACYANRFDGNFANDRRTLSDTSITFPKLKKLAGALDMKITLTIEDADKPEGEKVVNPMNTVISTVICGGRDVE